MKYVPNAMKCDTQSRSSSLIINMIFEIADLDPKLIGQIWSQNCDVLQFLWHLVQIKHANYEYSTWNWRS